MKVEVFLHKLYYITVSSAWQEDDAVSRGREGAAAADKYESADRVPAEGPSSSLVDVWK